MLLKENPDFFLRPLAIADCLALSDACCLHYAAAQSDSWRRYEWPFASQEAALQYGTSLVFAEPPVEGLSAAWALVETNSQHCVGLIAVTHAAECSGTGLLGTYIRPDRRGRGWQKSAKHQLFTLFDRQVRHYICLIASDNTASLNGLRKCDEFAELAPIPASALPIALYTEWLRLNQPSQIFRLTPRRLRDSFNL